MPARPSQVRVDAPQEAGVEDQRKGRGLGVRKRRAYELGGLVTPAQAARRPEVPVDLAVAQQEEGHALTVAGGPPTPGVSER